MKDSHPEYITKEAVESLIKKLNLPGLDAYSQDWEFEAADPLRVDEFISSYENNTLNKEEKFALMALIISSFNDALEKGKANNQSWNKIRNYLINEYYIHKNTILYWALDDENIEDCFAVTQFMRDIIKEFGEKSK